MLEGGAYDGVRLKDVLQMSSGARWNEDYSDPESDINRWLHILSDGGSLDAFAAGRVRGFEPGAYNRYNTTDTHVLGMVVRGATGRSLTEYFREKLWDPLGAEADAFWVVDSTGAEVAGGGLNAILRDYAKLGELYRKWRRLEGATAPFGGLGESLGDAGCAPPQAGLSAELGPFPGVRLSVVGAERHRRVLRHRRLQSVRLRRSGNPHGHRADRGVPWVRRRPSG